MGNFLQDIRYGLRVFAKKPASALIAIATLAIGIGATTTIFNFINGIFLRPLPYQHSDRLVFIEETSNNQSYGRTMSISFPNYLDWRERNSVFDGIGAWMTGGATIAEGVDPEYVQVGMIASGVFEILGVSPQLGRTISPEEDRPNQNPVVILSDGIWKRRFGSDKEIVGKSILVNARPRTVIGVMPPGFNFPGVTELWMPLALDTKMFRRTDHGLDCMALLKSGVSIERAQAEMDSIAKGIEQENPVTNEGLGVKLTDFRRYITGDFRLPLFTLLGAVGCVLLIACANVANILLARATSRQKEIAIRAAVGGSRRRILRQLLTESLLLGVSGGAIGIVLSLWARDIALKAFPGPLPFWMTFEIDGRVLGFTIAIAVLTPLVFGLAPAIFATRLDLNSMLKEAGRSSGSGSGSHRIRGALVVAQTAVSLVLLAGSGLMMMSFINLQHVRPGFDPTNVVTSTVPLPRFKYNDEASRRVFYDDLLTRIRSLPGVTHAAAIAGLPLVGDQWGRSLTVEGWPVLSVGQAPIIQHDVVTPGYFETMGIPLLQGRDFLESDGSSGPPVTIIDEDLARSYFPDGDAVGKRVRFGPPEDNEPWHTIVGVAGAVRHQRLQRTIRNCVYLPYREISISAMTLVVKADGAASGVSSEVAEQVKRIDSGQPVTSVFTMNEVIANSIWQPRLYAGLFVAFGAVALLLASVGIFGVMSCLVTEQVREIGIRVALGAQTGDVLRMVIGHGLRLTLTGVGIGLTSALGLTRLLGELLFGIGPSDPVTFGTMCVILISTAFLACFIPARRAARVDPMIALRHE